MSECRIRLRRGDQEIDLEGPEAFVDRQFKRLAPLFGLSEPSEMPLLSVRRNVTLQAFLMDKQALTPEDRLLCMAYWLERFEGADRLDLSALTAWAPMADLAPDDVAQLVTSNVTRQRMVQENGDLSLSYSGEQAVKEGFD